MPPFTAEQRAWLNGFFAGIFGPSGTAGSGAMSFAAPQTEPEPEEEFPWHDPALEMPERLALAEGKPLKRRMMAAMAQLDCGQCGYLCQTYAEAIAEGREDSLSLCVPGRQADGEDAEDHPCRSRRETRGRRAGCRCPAAEVGQACAMCAAPSALAVRHPSRMCGMW